ncbi:protein NUCLEAR FUSION DEFECTIVE 6, mitochondrial [Silene latifolia]|uniref:protein NUCLEAR FUSION DEFECTIVE 6, mitochondrial n=1 Tax=Silene latifolia TaxID=37657 RepID=UPI003D76B22B
MMNTSSLICRRLSNIGCKLKSASSLPNLLKSPASASPMRISRRLPVETSCIMTMLPLHSAIASARLQSVLSVDSQSWCLVPLGMSMPL